MMLLVINILTIPDDAAARIRRHGEPVNGMPAQGGDLAWSLQCATLTPPGNTWRMEF
jgi:hypothetical protein